MNIKAFCVESSSVAAGRDARSLDGRAWDAYVSKNSSESQMVDKASHELHRSESFVYPVLYEWITLRYYYERELRIE